MDGISNVLGTRTVSLTIDGKLYTLRPKNLDEYAIRERYILERKPNPLELLHGLPPLPEPPAIPIPPDAGASSSEREVYHVKHVAYCTAKKIRETAVETRVRLEEGLRRDAQLPRFVSFADDAAFDQSLHGIAFKFWRALREDHPEIDGVPAALKLLERLGSARFSELQDKLLVTDEKDILGN